jgi:hypothetical protein
VYALVLVAALPLAARAQTCVPQTTQDWMASTGSSAPVRPADCATVEQSPPDFSWPDLSADAQYTVTLTYPDGHSRSSAAAQNWINWDEVLPAGNYTWQVQAANAAGTQLSQARRFTVAAGAVAFLVPAWNVLFDRAAAKAHPRALPDAATLATMLEQRQPGLNLLLGKVDAQLDAAPEPEPTSASVAVIEAQSNAQAARTLNAAFAWVATGQERYFLDALRHAQHLASWDPRGTTSHASADQASRQIAWTLTLAYDWLAPRLDTNQKSALLASVLARATDMYNDLLAGRARIAVHPYDSHGNNTLTHLAVICVLLAGDIPEAQIGLRDALPLALSWTSPWGGEDGGYANGTAYAGWDTGDRLLAWYTLRWALDVDLAQKAWVRNFGRFAAYFVPPGTPAGAFGDGAEMAVDPELWARYGKAYTVFAPTALGRWYAAQLSGEDASRLELLLAPLGDPGPAPYPAGTPNAALFPSIGWAAMHSDLADPARVSVYFKSSSFGSFNHSHADQNSFVINAGGQRLAIDSGYYDSYASPHWWQWYKQTQAHNAITGDGGLGQRVFEQVGDVGRGRITRFAHTPAYDIVTGDAVQAYGGALREAMRSLVYLRPNHILVYDRLASDAAHRWEWNIHAVNAIGELSNTRIAIANNGQSLCVDMLAGPEMAFFQTDRFTADPSGTWSPQRHGSFYSTAASAAAEFIALLNVGCTPTTASASKSGGVWTVPVNDKTITIAADGSITVQ